MPYKCRKTENVKRASASRFPFSVLWLYDAMPLWLQIIWITACALALCIYAGWGATQLALPASLRPQAALFVPLVGYAITIWLGYLGVSSVLNLRWSLALLL